MFLLRHGHEDSLSRNSLLLITRPHLLFLLSVKTITYKTEAA